MHLFVCSRRHAATLAALLTALLLIFSSGLAQTWSPQNSGGPFHWVGVSFVNSSYGWVSATGGHVWRTTNGGASWSGDPYQVIVTAWDVEFVDVNNGWAVGTMWPIMHSVDGGINWVYQPGGVVYDSHLRAVRFVDLSNGWAVGESGHIVHTTNGGSTWTLQTSGTTQYLSGVDFVDANNGWVVGDAHTVRHTTNGGTAWTAQTVATNQGFSGVDFVDAQNGWVVGYWGTIAHTTNGGTTWTLQTSGTTQGLNAVSFVNAQHGWVCGESGTILRTTNGGTAWSPQVSGTSLGLYAIKMLDVYSGWVTGESGTVLHYSAAGGDPAPLDVQIGQQFCLDFDSRHVRVIRWCSPFAGNPVFTYGAGCNVPDECQASCTPYSGAITWTAQLDSMSSDTSSPCPPPNRWWSARFTSASEGCICVNFDSQLSVELESFEAIPGNGTIALQWTTASEIDNDRFELMRDGTLIAQVATQGNGATGHAYTYNDRVANGIIHTYSLIAVDINGASAELAIRTVAAGLQPGSVVTEYTLYQNYPNPFNPTTSISYGLVEEGMVELAVYNLTGQKVATLVDAVERAGYHTATFDATGLPSGIYVSRIATNGFTATRKLLLMK